MSMSPDKQVCRYCDQPIQASDLVTTHSYWKGFPFSAHRNCAEAGRKAEAMECQIIDADCNDCFHFQRGHLIPLSPGIQEQIRLGAVPNFNSGIWTGHCKKFDKPTRAYPNMWTGRECFEHRRAIRT